MQLQDIRDEPVDAAKHAREGVVQVFRNVGAGGIA